MKLRKIDYVIIFVCAIAAALCGVGSKFAAPCFVLSSSLGLVDSIKNRILSAALINGIFLTLNLYNTFAHFFG